MSTYGEIRNNQLITTFGIGAIFNSRKNMSVMIRGLEWWNLSEMEELHEKRLEKKLGIKKFLQPRSDLGKVEIIPSVKFPEWLFCPTCGKLASKNYFGNENYCRRCYHKQSKDKKNLVPSRFVIVCPKGHISDFPYSWWVHSGNSCDSPDLYISSSAKSVALGSLIVECRNCKDDAGNPLSRNLSGIFRKRAFSRRKCSGKSPWLDSELKEDCQEIPRTLQRGSSAVYYSITESAISIPPFSSIYQDIIEKALPAINQFNDQREIQIKVLNGYCEEGGLEIGPEELLGMIEDQKAILEGQNEDLRTDEYKALLHPIRFVQRSEFVAESETVPDSYRDLISKITLVHKLRIVTALKGFNRIIRDDTKIANLGKQNKGWLPGTETLGEGVFIELDRRILDNWKLSNEKFISDRINKLKTLQRKSSFDWIKDVNITPEFILIHTFSHLFIKQLTFECGYSSSALKERLYINNATEENNNNMCGVLIYTASSDSEGGLGGLARQGKSDRLVDILNNSIENSNWCSTDPLCIENRIQSADSVSLAACHSCSHLPESACEHNNCFLDRGLVTGTHDEQDAGYFTFLKKEAQ